MGRSFLTIIPVSYNDILLINLNSEIYLYAHGAAQTQTG